MKVLVIGRGYPEVQTGMVGIFEFEQAKAVANFCKETTQVLYTFCDNRSFLRLRRINSIKKNSDKIKIYGMYLPIGGLPSKLFNIIKTKLSVGMLKRAVNKFGKPDIIHIHFPMITLTEGIWEYLLSLETNIVITEHYSRVQNKELTIQQIKLLRKIVLKTKRFICVNNLLPKSIKELTGVQREFDVVPNLVTATFKKEEKKDDDIYRFIAIGRLVKGKNFDLLIDAFAMKFKDMSKVMLIIVGGGEEYKSLKKKILSYNMEEKIILKGFQDREQTAQLLRNSDSYISASSFETFGVPVVEAMFCGKPVIIADTSPLKGYINSQRGFLFKSGDVKSLADAMELMYDRRFVNNSFEIAEFAEKHFSDRAIAEQLCSIYKSCLKDK